MGKEFKAQKITILNLIEVLIDQSFLKIRYHGIYGESATGIHASPLRPVPVVVVAAPCPATTPIACEWNGSLNHLGRIWWSKSDSIRDWCKRKFMTQHFIYFFSQVSCLRKVHYISTIWCKIYGKPNMARINKTLLPISQDWLLISLANTKCYVYVESLPEVAGSHQHIAWEWRIHHECSYQMELASC